MHNMMIGAIAMGFLVAAAHFLQFWRTTRDRLFLLFSASFLILAVNRIAIGFHEARSDGDINYWIRFSAFALILLAILDKNRSGRLPNDPASV
ncbi:MAG: hypothetical protein K2X38_06690 [Gemmataceae bacterium]|nr:hypothetical protein [Gemmataceae bacterium]